MENKEILLLVDGNALIHRSYHGIPPLRTKDGQLVNAVYGFINSILIAIKQFEPKYLVVAFDVAKKTFRNNQYELYKAHRKPTDKELIDQIPLVKKACEVLNFTQIGIKGYEADDVIGTVANQIQRSRFKDRNGNRDLKTIIVTGDMDTLQLVRDDITLVWSVARGLKRAQLYNEQAVLGKYGFEPNNLVDYKALRGDASDNIPGVKGIGDKTATNLIKEFGSIKNLYTFLEKKSQDNNQKSKKVPKFKISERVNKLLADDKEKAFLSKKLATIYCEVPLEFTLVDAKISNYDKNEVIKFFNRLEFKSLVNKLPESKKIISQEKLF